MPRGQYLFSVPSFLKHKAAFWICAIVQIFRMVRIISKAGLVKASRLPFDEQLVLIVQKRAIKVAVVTST